MLTRKSIRPMRTWLQSCSNILCIADAIHTLAGTGLWDEEDGFYYDRIRFDHSSMPLKVRSLVGLLPLITVEVFEDQNLQMFPGFYKRLVWFRKYRQELPHDITHYEHVRGRRLLALPSRERLQRMLRYMLDENQFSLAARNSLRVEISREASLRTPNRRGRFTA
jgi:hypothetical protein